MSLVTAILYFEVDNLWVETELLGARSSIEFGGYTCTIVFPQERVDPGLGPPHPAVLALGSYVNDSSSGEEIKTAVLLLCVEVEIPSELLASDYQSDDRPRELIDRDLEMFAKAGRVAEDLATHYVRWVRVKSGQSWLGPSTIRLSARWRSVLIDVNGDTIPLGYHSPGPSIRFFRVQPALTAADHAAVLKAAVHGEETPLAETLLADAEYMSVDAAHRDVRLGVLLAAIACEVKVKEAITAVAQPSQVALVDVIAKHHLQVSVPAFLRFHLVLDAICGRSLHRENRPLFNRVKSLFEARNKVAHIGHKTLEEGEDLVTHLETAREAFAWLNAVIDAHGRP